MLDHSFFARDAVTVARELIGWRLFRVLDGGALVGGVIVEAEAYRQDDPASHAHRGPTPRARTMYGPPGVSYVYFIYGMYDCFNIVCEPEGSGAAVLVRAIDPTHGLAEMWRNRYPGRPPADRSVIGSPGATRCDRSSVPSAEIRNLTSGPGKLCRALGITRERHNGAPLRSLEGGSGPDDLVIAEREPAGEPVQVACGPRVGIRAATTREWRFWMEGNPFVSRASSTRA